MNPQLLIVAPMLGAVLALGLFAWHLNARLGKRLAALEERLEEGATERAAILGEELVAQRLANEHLLAELARLGREVERLGADVVHRELYRGDTPRHTDAVAAARHGADARTLVREHGLPLEEAELLVSLYADAAGVAGSREEAL